MSYTDAEAIEATGKYLALAAEARESAQRLGVDVTSGDSGIPMLTLAAQFTAEAQAWATLAVAITQALR